MESERRERKMRKAGVATGAPEDAAAAGTGAPGAAVEDGGLKTGRGGGEGAEDIIAKTWVKIEARFEES